MSATEFVEHLREVFAGFGPIQARRMFGGHGIYHDDLIFALVVDNALYLKADAVNLRHFTELNLPPFRYAKGGKQQSIAYHLAPEEIFEDAELAAVWARRSFEAALRARTRKAARSKR